MASLSQCHSTRLQRPIPLAIIPSGHLATSLTPPSLSRQPQKPPQKHIAFAMEASESLSKQGQHLFVTQHSPPSVGDDGGQRERREGVSELSPIKIHELDRVAQKLDNAAYAVYEDVVGFGRIDLESVSQSDSTCRLFESVTEAHASAKIWSDAYLATAKSRQ